MLGTSSVSYMKAIRNMLLTYVPPKDTCLTDGENVRCQLPTSYIYCVNDMHLQYTHHAVEIFIMIHMFIIIINQQ